MSELKPCPFCGSHNVKMFYDERQNYHVECYGCNKTVSFHIVKESSWRKAVATWNRRAQPANEPLTLDELREMDGEPVWLKDGIGEGWFLAGAVVGSKIYFCEKSIAIGEPISECGKTWLAYSHKPKEEHHDAD